MLPPDALYGSTYGFRTSESTSSKAGTEFFIQFLDRVAGQRQFNHALDVGCNDLHLLRRLEGRAVARTGIDPILSREDASESEIQAIGSTVEETDLTTLAGGPVDLVLCRHTLEHIAQPRAVVQALVENTAEDGLLVFESPGFDRLLARHRFDQIFHEHLQYFSRSSFFRLLMETGAQYVAHAENPHHWGALLVAFKRGGRRSASPDAPAPRRADIEARYETFQRHARATRQMLQVADTPVVGYGAAQMLPSLAYHFSGFGPMQVIVDDDAGKDGCRYPGMDLVVRTPSSMPEWSRGTVVVTALDAVDPILRKLLGERPRNIILPLSQF